MTKRSEKGLEINARLKNGRLRLGELADKIEKKYGASRLEEYAKKIGVNSATLEKYRTVYRNWKEDIPALGPDLPAYTTLRNLQKHPDRVSILKDKPKLRACQARKLMKEYEEGEGAEVKANAEADAWHNDYKKWSRQYVIAGKNVLSYSDFAAKLTAEKRRRLVAAVGKRTLLEQPQQRLERGAKELAELLKDTAEADEAKAATKPHARRAAPAKLNGAAVAA